MTNDVRSETSHDFYISRLRGKRGQRSELETDGQAENKDSEHGLLWIRYRS